MATAGSKLGTILVDGTGRSLYLWHGDTGMRSNCSGACAGAWPPLITQGAPKAGHGVAAGKLGTTRRSDGSLQVTYAGHPLYTYIGDSGPGQTSGQGSDAFGAAWDVVPVSGATADAAGQSTGATADAAGQSTGATGSSSW